MRYLKPIYNFINEEAIPLNTAKEYVAYGKDRPSWLVDKLNELFDNQQRIYIPVEYEEIKKISRTQKDIERVLNTLGYKIKDYGLGMAYQIDNPKRVVRIGKLLNSVGDTFLLKLFTEDKDRTLAKQKDDYSIVICQHPYDITAMTTGREWSSCLDVLGGANRHFIPEEIKSGTFTVYFIKTSDRNINNPIGRINVKLYSENDNKENQEDVDNYNEFPEHWVWIPDTGEYGSFPNEGIKTLKKWLMQTQNYNDGYLYYKISNTYAYSGTAYVVELEIYEVDNFDIIEKKPDRVIWTRDIIIEDTNYLEPYYNFINLIFGSNNGFYLNDFDWVVVNGYPKIEDVIFEMDGWIERLTINLSDFTKMYKNNEDSIFGDVSIQGGGGIDYLVIKSDHLVENNKVIVDLLSWFALNDIEIGNLVFTEVFIEKDFDFNKNVMDKLKVETLDFYDVSIEIFYLVVNHFLDFENSNLNLINISSIIGSTNYQSELYEKYPKFNMIDYLDNMDVIKNKKDISKGKVNLLIDSDIEFDRTKISNKDLIYEYFSVDGNKETTYAELSNDLKVTNDAFNFSELTLKIRPEIFEDLSDREGRTFLYADGRISNKGLCGYKDISKKFIFEKIRVVFYGDALSNYKYIPFKLGNLPMLNKTMEIIIDNKGDYFEQVKLEICTHASTDVNIMGVNLGNLDIFKCDGEFNNRRNSIRNLTCYSCGLTSLKGIPSLIKNVNVSNNELEDLEYLDFEGLEKLNINYNNFKGVEYLDQLSSFMIANPTKKFSDFLNHTGGVLQMNNKEVYKLTEIEEYLKNLID